jgi:photosystem II stability/assembly factor-like uncharacterized protein
VRSIIGYVALLTVACASNKTAGTSATGTTGPMSTTSGAGGSGAGGSAVNGAGGLNPVTGAPAQKCKTAVNTSLPATAPKLAAGTWTDITPAALVPLKGSHDTLIGQGLAMDPCNVATLYWGSTPYDTTKGGLFKTTDGGGSWTKVGPFDAPVHVRIDPTDPKHLYVGDGVRGATMGFWVSRDGGATWAKPNGFANAAKSAGIDCSGLDDVYDIAVDPTNFDHVLVSLHSPYSWCQFESGAGVLESRDGGNSWYIGPRGNYGQGHSINFLYQPDLKIGDPNTWLLGTQMSGGYYRTTDAGKTWTKVSDNGIAHGGGTLYYSKQGVAYASGLPSNLRSADNGATWTLLSPGGSSTCVFGDGTTLYTAPTLGDNPYFVSPESDGTVWTPYQNGAQKWHNAGPFEMAYDAANGIVYSSNWEQGVMALKVATTKKR